MPDCAICSTPCRYQDACRSCGSPVCDDCREVITSYNGDPIKPRRVCLDCVEMGLWQEDAVAEIMAGMEDDDGTTDICLAGGAGHGDPGSGLVDPGSAPA